MEFETVENRVRKIAGDRALYVLTDTNVDRLTRTLLSDCPRLVVEAGESCKSLDGAMEVWEFLEKNGAVRNSILINVGGGMVSDLGGFAASTFKRGIGCINLPTTLLAAVDAAIGGKTGINFMGLKNEIGTCALPLAVMPLMSLFRYLPEEEWLSGVGEAIKTGMLAGDELYRLATSRSFIQDRESEVVKKVVETCAEFKQKVVAEDFKEKGKRRILNIGHTWGHALEAWMMARGKSVPHGIAVAYGLLETLKKSGLATDAYQEILNKYFPALDITEKDREEISRYMAYDKKNNKIGEPNWVLLNRV